MEFPPVFTKWPGYNNVERSLMELDFQIFTVGRLLGIDSFFFFFYSQKTPQKNRNQKGWIIMKFIRGHDFSLLCLLNLRRLLRCLVV